MRAVNLIPAEERKGAGGVAGRSGGAAYVLLGLLGVLVLLIGARTLAAGSVADKREEVAALEQQAVAAEARAASLAQFSQFATLSEQRVSTVTQIASSRFDFAHAMRELARAVPSDVSLTALQATVSPDVQLKNSAGAPTSSLRAALPVPAVELVGCTSDQRNVARMVTRMRTLDGVSRVALQSSSKLETAGGGGGGGATGGTDCRNGDTKLPQFALVVFFDRAAGAVPTTPEGVAAAKRSRVSATTITETGK